MVSYERITVCKAENQIHEEKSIKMPILVRELFSQVCHNQRAAVEITRFSYPFNLDMYLLQNTCAKMFLPLWSIIIKPNVLSCNVPSAIDLLSGCLRDRPLVLQIRFGYLY